MYKERERKQDKKMMQQGKGFACFMLEQQASGATAASSAAATTASSAAATTAKLAAEAAWIHAEKVRGFEGRKTCQLLKRDRPWTRSNSYCT